MRNLLMFRLQVWKSEIMPELKKRQDEYIAFVVNNKAAKAILQQLDKYNLNCINKIITIEELLNGKLDNMKFDYIVGNPPYQKKVGPKKSQLVWPELTVKFFDLLKDHGKMSLIHPSSWRFLAGGSSKHLKKVKEIYCTHKITHMEFNDYTKGIEVFGATTDFDVVTLIKEPSDVTVEIHTKTDGVVQANLKEMSVIPTDKFLFFNKLRAKESDEKVELLYSRSDYGSDKKNMSSVENEEFRYPCVYGFPESCGIKLIHSNTNKNGHFGISKLILVRAAQESILDLEGQYGMCQYASAIIDTPENLIKIKKAIETPEFKELKGYFCGIGQSSSKNSIIDAPGTMFKFLKEFRKDFWKDFIDD